MFVLVVAKEPVPGQVKTRLCPPCTPAQAAAIAHGALHDTFAAAVASGADEVIAALDGNPGPWLPAGVRIIAQTDERFDRRLAAAWSHTTGPGIQIGMDTPQVSAALLDEAMTALADDANDAVLGPADDGGWWAIGMPGAASDPTLHARVFHDIPMSRDDTGAAQLARLRSLDFRVGLLANLTDVDHFSEAITVAGLVPGGRFAGAVDIVASDTGDAMR